MRLIDADSFMAFEAEIPIKMGVRYAKTASFFFNKGCETVLEAIDAAPTIDPEALRPTAHWVETGEYVQTIDAVKIPVKICSGCHMDIALEEFESYCPHCGARMVNGDD